MGNVLAKTETSNVDDRPFDNATQANKAVLQDQSLSGHTAEQDTIVVAHNPANSKASRRQRRRRQKRRLMGHTDQVNKTPALLTPPAEPVRALDSTVKSSTKQPKRSHSIQWSRKLDASLRRAVANAERDGLVVDTSSASRASPKWNAIAQDLLQHWPDKKRKKGLSGDEVRQRAVMLRRREQQKVAQDKAV